MYRFSRNTFIGLALATLGPAAFACNIVEDEPPPDGAGDSEGLACFELAQVAAGLCPPPMSFVVDISTEDTIISVDDPNAGLQIGPNGWLINADASADWFAWGDFDQDCGFACTVPTCPGESVPCFVPSGGETSCFTCIAGDFSDPATASACGDFAIACAGGEGLDSTAGDTSDATGGADESTSGGADTTGGGGGGGDEGGLDSTGVQENQSGSVHEWIPGGSNDGLTKSDCKAWGKQLDKQVTVGINGNIRVDPGLIETLAMHMGEHITECDGTRLEHTKDGFLRVKRTNDTSLLSLLGLVPGDVLRSAGGKSLRGDAIIMELMGMFLSSGGPSSLDVMVHKDGDPADRMELRLGFY